MYLPVTIFYTCQNFISSFWLIFVMFALQITSSSGIFNICSLKIQILDVDEKNCLLESDWVKSLNSEVVCYSYPVLEGNISTFTFCSWLMYFMDSFILHNHISWQVKWFPCKIIACYGHYISGFQAKQTREHFVLFYFLFWNNVFHVIKSLLGRVIMNITALLKFFFFLPPFTLYLEFL